MIDKDDLRNRGSTLVPTPGDAKLDHKDKTRVVGTAVEWQEGRKLRDFVGKHLHALMQNFHADVRVLIVIDVPGQGNAAFIHGNLPPADAVDAINRLTKLSPFVPQPLQDKARKLRNIPRVLSRTLPRKLREPQ